MTHDGFRAALHGRRTAISVLVVVGLLTSACTSSTSSASPSSPVEATLRTANGAMVDINTGAITPLPASIATSGTYYAVAPDRTRVAYNACCNPPDPLFLANLDGTLVRPVTPKGWDAYGAQWSPDGSLLVYQQRHEPTMRLGNLFVQDISGRATRLTNFDQTQPWGWWFTFPSFASDGHSVLFQLPRGDPNHPIWDLWYMPNIPYGKQTLVRRNAGWGGYSPDGRWLGYLSPVNAHDFTGRGLWITGVHGGTPRNLVPDGHLTWPRWSPDGTRISYSDRGSIYVLNVATRSATKVAEGGNAEWFDDHTLIVGNPTN